MTTRVVAAVMRGTLPAHERAAIGPFRQPPAPSCSSGARRIAAPAAAVFRLACTPRRVGTPDTAVGARRGARAQRRHRERRARRPAHGQRSARRALGRRALRLRRGRAVSRRPGVGPVRALGAHAPRRCPTARRVLPRGLHRVRPALRRRSARSLGGALVRRRLARTFDYRHRVTAQDVAAHARARRSEMKILVSGSSGLIGSALVPFLTTGGHDGRASGAHGGSGAPAPSVVGSERTGTIDAAALEGFDAVVHLAGENIASGRWTAEKKARIYASRVDGTKLLVQALTGAGAAAEDAGRGVGDRLLRRPRRRPRRRGQRPRRRLSRRRRARVGGRDAARRGARHPRRQPALRGRPQRRRRRARDHAAALSPRRRRADRRRRAVHELGRDRRRHRRRAARADDADAVGAGQHGGAAPGHQRGVHQDARHACCRARRCSPCPPSP